MCCRNPGTSQGFAHSFSAAVHLCCLPLAGTACSKGFSLWTQPDLLTPQSWQDDTRHPTACHKHWVSQHGCAAYGTNCFLTWSMSECFPSTLTSLPASAEVMASGFKIGSKIIESKCNSKCHTYISLTTRDLFSLSALPWWWPLQSFLLLKLPTPVPLGFTLNLSKSLNPTLVLP